MPDVSSAREFVAALLGSVHFLSPNQQSGIHCLIICAIQLLTPNNLGGTWRRICSPDIRNVSVLKVLRNRSLQIDIYVLTYFLTLHYVTRSERWNGSRYRSPDSQPTMPDPNSTKHTFIMLGDRGTRVLITCPESLHESETAGGWAHSPRYDTVNLLG